MSLLFICFERAKKSSFYLWLLNRLLWFIIPFNKPHRFKIIYVGEEEIHVKMPYRRKNFNHLRGLHACGLAALCEYSCGLMLMSVLKNDYRIIMKDLQMAYHYQGKAHTFVRFNMNKQSLLNEINTRLQHAEAVFKEFQVEAFDIHQNKICTAQINWQIKNWSKVKTKSV